MLNCYVKCSLIQTFFWVAHVAILYFVWDSTKFHSFPYSDCESVRVNMSCDENMSTKFKQRIVIAFFLVSKSMYRFCCCITTQDHIFFTQHLLLFRGWNLRFSIRSTEFGAEQFLFLLKSEKRSFQKRGKGKRTYFTSDDEVKHAITSWIKQRSPEFCIGMPKLVLLVKNVLNDKDDYVEK